jgi:hypothetical protein
MSKKQILIPFYKTKQENDSAYAASQKRYEAGQKQYWGEKIKNKKETDQFKKQLQDQKTPWSSTAKKSPTPAKSPLIQKKTGGVVKSKTKKK